VSLTAKIEATSLNNKAARRTVGMVFPAVSKLCVSMEVTIARTLLNLRVDSVVKQLGVNSFD